MLFHYVDKPPQATKIKRSTAIQDDDLMTSTKEREVIKTTCSAITIQVADDHINMDSRCHGVIYQAGEKALHEVRASITVLTCLLLHHRPTLLLYTAQISYRAIHNQDDNNSLYYIVENIL